MLFKAPKTRTFHYSPRFYSERQEGKTQAHRISFRQHLKYTHKKRSWIGLLIMLIVALVVLINLNRMRRQVPEKVELDHMEIVK